MIELPCSSISPTPSSSGSAIRTFPSASGRPTLPRRRASGRLPVNNDAVSASPYPESTVQPRASSRVLGFLLQPRSARNQQPQPRSDSPSNRGEQQPSQTQPGRALHKARRSQQGTPQEPCCPATRRNARFERRPYRVVETWHPDDRGDFSLAHRPHQQRAGRAARQHDRGSDGQSGQHADDERIGVVQRQRQQRAVARADDIQFLQRVDIGRDVAVGQQECLWRAGGAGGPGQQCRIVGCRGRQILRSFTQQRQPPRRNLPPALVFIDQNDLGSAAGFRCALPGDAQS